MTIKKVQLKDLSPHPSNSDIYQDTDIEDLAINISKVGLLSRIVINNNNVIISGHRRLRALKFLGVSETEVEVSAVTKDDEILHLISHNQYRNKTTSELIREIELLHKLYSLGQGSRSDLTSGNNARSTTRDLVGEKIGLSGRQVSKLLFIKEYGSEYLSALDSGKITVAIAYNKALAEKRKNEINNSIETNHVQNLDYKIYNKSSEDMSETDSDSVNLIFTSPPYFGVEKHNIKEGIGSGESLSEYISQLKKVFTECFRVLNNKGSIYINVSEGGKYATLQGSCERLLLTLIDIGFIYRSRIIWNKINPQPKSIQKVYMPKHEIIYFLTKGKDYHFDYIDGYDKDITENYVGRSYGSGIHPTTFPESLVTQPILKSSKIGDTILDPFCGSGTVGKVSIDNNRRFIGYDLDETYCKMSIKRLNDTLEGTKSDKISEANF